MWFYYVCFLCILALRIGTRRTKLLRLLLIGVALLLIAGLRAETVDHDYLGYLEYYDNVLYAGFVNVEPTFIALAHAISSTLDNPLILFLVYAALGTSLKLIGIAQLSRYPLASALIYFSGFFLLWEMTQIRAAVAGGLLLVSIRYIRERRAIPYFSLASLAALFHYGAIIYLPLFFLRPDRIKPWVYYLLIPVATAIYMSGVSLIDFASFAPIQLIELKIQSYETYVDAEDHIFNAVYLARCALAFLLLANQGLLRRQNAYFLLLIKIYFVALFVHVALASIPGIASRLSELMLVVEVILIPMLAHLAKERVVGHTAVVMVGLAFLTFSLYYTKLLMPYAISPALIQ